MNEEKIKKVFLELLEDVRKSDRAIPVGISNRHIHLSKQDCNLLFGNDYELMKIKDLSQIGQFAAKESVTIVGPRGAIEKVRILGPVRKETQIEILASDNFKLGTKADMRMSGDLQDTQGITILGPKGTVNTKKGLIVAQRHIHMLPEDASRFGVVNNQIVDIRVDTERGGILSNVVIRVAKNSSLECHLDQEEANALGLDSKSKIFIVH